MGWNHKGKIEALCSIAAANWGRCEVIFARHGWYNPGRWPLDVFIRRWVNLYTDGLSPEQAEQLWEIVHLDDLKARPELQALVETRAAVDYIDARHIFNHFEAVSKPGLDERTRIRLDQAERDRKARYRAEMMERNRG